jgi:D-alanyl-lipoteichoic acid acyltransferase DltB (MBOAT superfamily)
VVVSGGGMIPYLMWGIIIAWGGGLLISKTDNIRAKNYCMVISIILLVGELACLKYVRLGINLWNLLPWVRSNPIVYDVSGIIAPIGISYYTLSVIGYILEVYWGNIEAEGNLLKMATFVTYFPQMTSGPITRYGEMSPQLFGIHHFEHKKVLFGIQRILWGLFKKLVIADRASMFVSEIYNNYESYQGWYILIAVMLFALQLYTDFSGCMDIICGASECFGIRLPENFNSPFMAESVSEFWDRWHITMGKWFRDFLLYPLMKSDFNQGVRKKLKKHFGKNISKNVPTYLCMSVVWVTIGIWHGGAFKYIFASGILQGFYLIMGQVFSPLMKKAIDVLGINTNALSWHLFRRIRTLFCLCTSWIFIKADNFTEGLYIIKSMFSTWNPYILFDDSLYSLGLTWKDFNVIYVGVIIMMLVAHKKEMGVNIREKISEQNLWAQWLIMLVSIFAILILGIYGPSYNASDFIYKNF